MISKKTSSPYIYYKTPSDIINGLTLNYTFSLVKGDQGGNFDRYDDASKNKFSTLDYTNYKKLSAHGFGIDFDTFGGITLRGNYGYRVLEENESANPERKDSFSAYGGDWTSGDLTIGISQNTAFSDNTLARKTETFSTILKYGLSDSLITSVGYNQSKAGGVEMNTIDFSLKYSFEGLIYFDSDSKHRKFRLYKRY